MDSGWGVVASPTSISHQPQGTLPIAPLGQHWQLLQLQPRCAGMDGKPADLKGVEVHVGHCAMHIDGQSNGAHANLLFELESLPTNWGAWGGLGEGHWVHRGALAAHNAMGGINGVIGDCCSAC